MKLPFLKVVALATMLATAGTIVPLGAMFVRTPPPRPVAVGPLGRRPGRGWVWTNGYWTWAGGRRGMYGGPAGGDGRHAPVQYGFRRGGVEAEVDIHL
jgi:hypothetical protein